MEEMLNSIGERAKAAKTYLGILGQIEKNRILNISADALVEGAAYIISENARDVKKAEEVGLKPALIDRLSLSENRIESMAEGLRNLAELPDPVGEMFDTRTLPNGMLVGKKRVPLGVAAIIYESRPNVTSDAFGLCLKSGNAVILRGGKEAFLSNTAIVETIRAALRKNGFNEDIIQFIPDISRDTVAALMKLDKYVDVIIPRGGARLIRYVIENSTIPTIETGVGNCHIYVDESADLDMAEKIIINAKTQRPGVCNACEKIVVHADIAERFLPRICGLLVEKGVLLRGDKEALAIVPEISLIEDDAEWFEEYLDLKIGIKIVPDISGAIDHIMTYTSGHSEAIITNDYASSQRFINEIDAAAVYINASTRFTDGEQFGLCAEIGISTQKLHARGPMGVRELTSYKYIIFGSGQIRE